MGIDKPLSIEDHIRRARLQRSLALGNTIASAIAFVWQGLKGASVLFGAPRGRTAPFAQRTLHR